jgi:hypothetical protein
MENETNNTLSSFLNNLYNSLGFNINDKKSKDKFNPYSVNNSVKLCLLYDILNNYSIKTEKKLPLPSGIQKINNDIIKVQFKDDLNTNTLNTVLDEKKIENVTVETNNIIL